MTQENYVQTPYGVFYGVASAETYEDGSIQSLMLNEQNMVLTHAGELIPYFSKDTLRRKYKASVSFHKNGMIKSVYLDQQQEIQTPIGPFPAELVTFYDTGELNRVFPLDGKISGFWSEEEEKQLHIPFSFSFDFSEFTAILTGICFYKSGDIRSITLYPQEDITVQTPTCGSIRVRNGFSLYESGRLESVEPAVPTAVSTPIGQITAYDINAVGVHADSNSLVFDESGRIKSIITTSDKIAVAENSGAMRFFAPKEIQSRLTDDEVEPVPMKIEFDYDGNTVSITDEKVHTFDIGECAFHIFSGEIGGCSASGCAGCSLCPSGTE